MNLRNYLLPLFFAFLFNGALLFLAGCLLSENYGTPEEKFSEVEILNLAEPEKPKKPAPKKRPPPPKPEVLPEPKKEPEAIETPTEEEDFPSLRKKKKTEKVVKKKTPGRVKTVKTVSEKVAPIQEIRLDAPIMEFGCPEPEYPQAARFAGQEGSVEVEIHIGSDGKVRGVRLKKNSGPPVFRKAAKKAAWGCRFAPPMFQGKRVETRRKRTFLFRLRH